MSILLKNKVVLSGIVYSIRIELREEPRTLYVKNRVLTECGERRRERERVVERGTSSWTYT